MEVLRRILKLVVAGLIPEVISVVHWEVVDAVRFGEWLLLHHGQDVVRGRRAGRERLAGRQSVLDLMLLLGRMWLLRRRGVQSVRARPTKRGLSRVAFASGRRRRRD